MGAFICQISEKDWNVSRTKGVYGNREKKPDFTGSLRDCDLMSVIRDLVSINNGDIIFFHIVKKETDEDSSIHGVYQARSQAFYESNKIWDNDDENFPFRFLFEPHPTYSNLCSNDSHIYVSDLYREIESRKIWSIATLENERNMERRAVRKISMDDAKSITELLLRDYKKGNLVNFTPYNPASPIPIENKIIKVNSIENSVKAIFLSKLKSRDPVLNNIFGNVIDYMNETFVAQTTRKLIDLLCISKIENGRIYYIIEAKSGVVTFNEEHLKQLLTYLDLFKQKSLVDPMRDRIIGGIMFNKCSDLVRYAINQLNEMKIFDGIKCINFSWDHNSNVHFGESYEIQDLFHINIPSVKINAIGQFNDFNEILGEEVSSFTYNNMVNSITPEITQIKENMTDESNNWRFHTRSFFIKKHDVEIDTSKLFRFIEELKEFVGREYSYDYMKVIPVIIAPSFSEDVIKKISVYNYYLSRPLVRLYSYSISNRL